MSVSVALTTMRATGPAGLAWRSAICAAFCIPLMAAGMADAQAIYTWTDKDGVVHFSNSARPDEAETAISGSARFRPVPLKVRNNQKLVKVKIGGTEREESVQMLVDTGAQMTLIDRSIAERVGVRWLRRQGIGGVNSMSLGAMVEVPRFQLGSTVLKNVNIVVSGQRGMNLLGMDILGRLDLTVGPTTLYRSR